jgi:UDP-4-amino-4,6-dideoxy-N-acetyl-beta-L-altrosamine N-acetyltransferase
MSFSLKNFTELGDTEKSMVLGWRNNDNIRKWMFHQELISLEQHRAFIDSLRNKKDALYFLLYENKDAVGVIDFTDIDLQKGSAEIGLYANPSLHGVGKKLMQNIISYGFGHLKLKQLYTAVFKSNTKAISLYRRFDFQQYKETKEILYMELYNEDR